MRKKNPLYYDLSRLPESAFHRRALARYKKDFANTRIMRRGKVLGSVGQLKRKDQLSKWFPNADVYFFDFKHTGVIDHIFDKYGEQEDIFDIEDVKDFVYDNPQAIRDYFGIANSKSIVLLADVEALTDIQQEALTPFMMVHDWGEDIFASTQSYPPDGFEDLWSDLQDIVFQQEMFNLYIPRLVHVQPWPHMLKPTRYGYDLKALRDMETQKTITPFIDYVLNLTGDGGSNSFSDVWALWCKREHLSPKQFWPIEQTIQSTLNYLESEKDFRRRDEFVSYIKENQNNFSLDKYCDQLNFHFARLLQYYKGRVVLITP